MTQADIQNLLITLQAHDVTLDKLAAACKQVNDEANDDVETWIFEMMDETKPLEYRLECREKLQAIGFDTSLFD